MLDINVRKKLYIVGIIVLIYVISMSIGYALFKESLTISGVASTVEYYEGDKLPVAAIIRDTANNRYYTADGTKSFIDFDSETWQEDTYQLNFQKKIGLVYGTKTITYVVSFTNPTTTSFTNGTINTEIEENYMSSLKEVSGSLSKTEVAPGETVDVMFMIKFNFLSELGEHQAKATVTYTYQNKPRYFYFIINYSH